MKAGHVGPGRESSFGVAIRLPFETTANEVIDGDDKLIHFRYFFTRKLMFLSQAEAVVCFPGGFGTMDEAFETLTLVQTGKASMIPIVFVEGEGDSRGYWEGFIRFVRDELLSRGWISPEDDNRASTTSPGTRRTRRSTCCGSTATTTPRGTCATIWSSGSSAA
jgi:uncharacterized protein (TIGR00730 family)